MAINKFQRSWLTFALSAKVAHIVVPSIYWNLVFSQTIGPIGLKFHVKNPYDKSAKIYTKYFGHMTKMAATPIYGKNLLKSSSPEPEGQWPWDLVCSIGDVESTKFVQMMILGWPWPA